MRLGVIAANGVDPIRAARLFGASEAIRETVGQPGARYIQSDYDHSVTIMQSALGLEIAGRAWSDGQALTRDEAIAEALAFTLEPEQVAAPSTTPENHPDLSLASAAPFDLTRREREILVLLCQRLTDSEIAERLFLSPRTASKHVGNILGKLGVRSRREAAAAAACHNLV